MKFKRQQVSSPRFFSNNKKLYDLTRKKEKKKRRRCAYDKLIKCTDGHPSISHCNRICEYEIKLIVHEKMRCTLCNPEVERTGHITN